MTRPRPRRLGPRITPPWPQHGMGLAVDQGSMRRPAFSCNHSICGRPKRSFSAATHAHRAPCRWGGGACVSRIGLTYPQQNDRGRRPFQPPSSAGLSRQGSHAQRGSALVSSSITDQLLDGRYHAPRHNICARFCPTPFSVQAHTTTIAC
jgi:hypothetical protein